MYINYILVIDKIRCDDKSFYSKLVGIIKIIIVCFIVFVGVFVILNSGVCFMLIK